MLGISEGFVGSFTEITAVKDLGLMRVPTHFKVAGFALSAHELQRSILAKGAAPGLLRQRDWELEHEHPRDLVLRQRL